MPQQLQPTGSGPYDRNSKIGYYPFATGGSGKSYLVKPSSKDRLMALHCDNEAEIEKVRCDFPM